MASFVKVGPLYWINFTLWANGSVPVLLTEGFNGNETILVKLTFSNVIPAIPSGVFTPPSICYGHGFVCEQGNITDLLMYRFHPAGDVTIDNRNTADALGDVSFVCGAGISTPDKHISIFMAKVNTTWGQYELCNNNECVGLADVPTVGHEAPEGVTYQGGQCNTNEGIGNWYSFNTDFKCANEINFDNCAWYQLGIGKTIEAQCLLQHGFFEACKKDGGLPYTTALNIWNTAFEFNETFQGGCPPVSSPASSSSSSSQSESEEVSELFRNSFLNFLLPIFSVRSKVQSCKSSLHPSYKLKEVQMM